MLRALVAGQSYSQFVKDDMRTWGELEQQGAFDGEGITISIITPLYNTPEQFLRDMVESVQAQTYGNWQLCLADGSDGDAGHVRRICEEYAQSDPRIAYKRLDKNLGIAANSNACVEQATGDYLAILDHDDYLHPAALQEVVSAIKEHDADLVYTDEAIFRSPRLRNVSFIHFKPDYAPDNLRANNYICHFTAFRASLLERAGGAFRDGFEGSQDHELILRLSRAAERIVHVPKVLYFWRSHSKSTSRDSSIKPYAGESGIRAVQSSLEDEGLAARVTGLPDTPTIYRCEYELRGAPRASVVIPSCDHVEDLDTCLASVEGLSTYPDLEVVVVENNCKDPRTFAYYEGMLGRWGNVRLLTWDGPFNWSAINNFGVREAATGDYVLLLNNDIKVITPSWVEEMLMYAQRPDVGCVVAMLYYSNNTIQHAGVVIGIGEQVGMDGMVATHAFEHVRRGELGYAGKLLYAQNYSAVTAACMLMRREVWDQVGGCDESFVVGYNDVDLCMRVRKAGYLVVWTPHAELYHYGSKSRGTDNTPQKRARELAERERFKKRWAKEMEAGDPYYNPNLGPMHMVILPERGRR